MLDNTQEVRTAPPPAPKRSPWYLLTGLILGLILGLVYAWLVNPVIYESSVPSILGDEDQDIYRSMIAQAYAATGNLERASLRLALLEDIDPIYALGAQAQRALAGGHESEARALALLASALQNPQTDQEPPPGSTPTQPTATKSPAGIPTHTLPVPTSTP